MITELRERLTAEMDHLVEELTVHIPLRLGRDDDRTEDALAMQRLVQGRIRSLRCLLAGLDSAHPDTLIPDHVGFGSVVRVEDQRNGEELTYTLMIGDLLDLQAGEISLGSPVGQALLGRVVGDEVEVTTPHGKRKLRILALTTIFERLRSDEAPTAECV